MSWRDTLAESLGYSRPESGKPKSRGQNPMDKLDDMDTIKAESNSVHLVHSVHSPTGATFPDKAPRATPPELTPAECQDVRNWPPETQRVFVAILDHLGAKGFPLAQAEALAYATMQVLMQRRGGPIGFAKSEVPDEVAELVKVAKDVLGDGVEVEWRPEHAPKNTDQAEQQADLVRCQDCMHFERGQGDRNNALGHCKGQPWDGNQGQWPKAKHRCSSYNRSKQNP